MVGYLTKYFKTVTSFYFIVPLVLYLSNQVMIYYGVAIAFQRNYLDDLLMMPITLSITLVGLRMIFQDINIKLDYFMVVGMIVLTSFVFEYWLPQQSPKYTADVLDIVCYIIGAIYFLKLLNKPG